jgi:hypothetical protein
LEIQRHRCIQRPCLDAAHFQRRRLEQRRWGLCFEPSAIPGPATIQTPLPDPKGASGRATIYFRKRFNFPGNPQLASIRIQHLVDDGCVVYLNGTRVHRYRMPDLAAYSYAQLSSSSGGDATYVYADQSNSPSDSSYIDPRPALVQGENVIAVEVHQNAFVSPGNASNSSDVTFALRFDAEIVTTGGEIALNEIMADNRVPSPTAVPIRTTSSCGTTLRPRSTSAAGA